MDEKRRGKLHYYFKQILQGQGTIQTTQQAKRFLEAICSANDIVSCIESILSSKNGVAALQQSIRVDVTLAFFNSPIYQLLHSLRNPDILAACGGDLLNTIIQHIVEPPTFWNFFRKHAEDGTLNSATLECFAWLLLRLLLNPKLDVMLFVAVASNEKIQRSLLEADELGTRSLYHKIQQAVHSLNTPISNTSDKPGGRHDNDFVNFRKIALLPSIEEIFCTDRPYLRFANDIDEVAEEDRLNAHLDNQFRLLRQDMIKSIKDELSWKSTRKIRKLENLRLVGVDYYSTTKWALELICDKGLPYMSKQRDSSARQDYLEKHKKILAHGALVGIFTAGTFRGFGSIWRREDKLSEDIPRLHVQLPSNDLMVRRTLQAIRDSHEIEILPFHTAVFAYEPILQQLQQARSLPLAEAISRWQAPQIIPKVDLTPELETLINKLESDHETQLQDLLSLPKPVNLDQDQASSFIAGLCQQVSLIQGPPGTGKSFIGAIIAKALYEHTKHKILVLSYTNHALDQCLDDLMKNGIRSKDIVRLGSSFKASNATKSLSLKEQARSRGHSLRSGDWALINSYNDDANDIGKRLKIVFADYVKSAARLKDVMEYLEFSDEYEEFYEAFQLPQDADFETIGKTGKKVDPYYLLDCWMRNANPNEGIGSIGQHPQVWSLPVDTRETHRKIWLNAILEERLQQVIDYGKQFNSKITATDKVRSEPGRRLMQDIRIIGCTTTMAAKMVTEIQSVQPEVVIIEEAGEILESHILAALGPETKQLILIGDHKQLRPKAHYDLSVEKGTGYDLNRSMFERLVLKDYPHQRLSKQYRMRPEISALVRKLTYPELIDAPTTQNRASLRGFRDNIVFFHHNVSETQGNQIYDPREGSTTSSKTNNFEAQMTLKCVKYIAQQGYRSDQIVVLTPYLGQLRLLFDVLKAENDPVLNDLDTYDLVMAGLMPAATAKVSRSQLRISTIDNYQGEESDVVIVCLTRSNEKGEIGFMSSPERLNVLISRARDGIIFLGNTKTFLNARKGKQLWTNFLGLLREGHHIYDGFPVQCEIHPTKQADISTAEEFGRLCPDGGCDAACDAVLKCGVHRCPSKCHQIFDHTKMACETIMSDLCTNGHKLSWKCKDQRPTTCRACDAKKKRDEKKAREDHEKLVADTILKQEHDAKISEIDAQIEIERQRIQELDLKEERKRAIALKLIDLQRARDYADKPTQVLTSSHAEPENHVEKVTTTTPSDQQEKLCDKQENIPTPRKPKLIPALEPSKAAGEWNLMKTHSAVSNDAIEDLMQMTGLESVKKWVVEFYQKLQTAQRQGVDFKQDRLGTVLVGNPGTGKTTVARLLAKFFAEANFVASAEFVESSGVKLANEGVDGVKKTLAQLLKNGGGVFFIDEAYQLVSGNSHGGGAVLDFLLTEIENNIGKIIFMFAGYEKQMEKFLEHNPGLTSRMPHQLKFADYSESELLHLMTEKIESRFNNRIQVEDGLSGLYMRIVIRRLHRQSGREGFGNARALENVIARITSAQSTRLTRERFEGLQPDDFFLSKEDVIGPEPSGALAKSIAWQKLQSMIGLESLKSTVRILLDRLVENYKRELKEQPPLEVSLNRLFLGSPGTGKTTVAKLYGQILTEIGMLSSSECVVKTPADFIGSVLGESERKTKAILDNTRGKVLVIDEAYMLSSISQTGDIYRTAVVDTLVSEVHSVTGDDRAVLLLGYDDNMKEMLRTVNPGLARRFPIENAFHFEDYNDEQLLAILNHKLSDQGLDATAEAKATAINLLGKLRRRPNFGNAGEVENVLSKAKDNYSKRPRKSTEISGDIVFQPQDFDPEYNRSNTAVEDCRDLFKDVIGSDDLVQRLTGYITSFVNASCMGMDPADVLPFNFVFKGPPGTGKTTTARKIGTVFFNMGFLASSDVVECSATDLVGEYVGQTGPKVMKKFDEALGKVLFVDEAYRLGEGHFAKEAVDEVVDCLTKDRYKSKMIVILAGYEGDINRLLQVNPGLSSRFPEEVMFEHLTPKLCIELLVKILQKNKNMKADLDMASPQSKVVSNLFMQLSGLSGWANGRDVETIASRIIAAALKAPRTDKSGLKLTWVDVLAQLDRIYNERIRRVTEKSGSSVDDGMAKLLKVADSRPLNQPTHNIGLDIETSTAPAEYALEEVKEVCDLVTENKIATSEDTESRDPGVPDAIWQQLRLDDELSKQEETARNENVAEAQTHKVVSAQQLSETVAEMKALEKQAAVDNEVRRKWEEMRLKAVLVKQKAEEAAARAEKLAEDERQAQKQEKMVQTRLKEMGVCCMGYRWIKQEEGYRCAGGAHFVSNSELGM